MHWVLILISRFKIAKFVEEHLCVYKYTGKTRIGRVCHVMHAGGGDGVSNLVLFRPVRRTLYSG